MSDYPKECDWRYDPGQFNELTERGVVTLEMIYSHFNHKDIWTEFHPEYWTIKSLMGSLGRLFRLHWEARFYQRGKAKDLGVLDDGQSKGPAIIIGSGPTLDGALPYLKDWKGAIFCNSSQASTLIYHGRHPDFVDIADCRVSPEELQAPWDYKKTSWIINPGVHPRLINFWKGQTYYYRIYEPYYDFYGKVQPRVYGSFIKTQSFPFGSQPPMAISHATALGYSPLFLVGCDFGFPGNIDRFTGWRKPKGKKWISSPPTTIGAQSKYIIETENGVLSIALHIFYRDQLFRVIALDVPQIFYCMVNKQQGIITPEQMPQVDFPDVIGTQGLGFTDQYRTSEEIRRSALRFLATKGMFLLQCKIGHKFVGMGDWREDLRSIVDMANQGNAGMDYDKAYKYLEELTEGMSFENLKKKPVPDLEKLSQTEESYIKEVEKIKQEEDSSADKDK